MKKSLAQPSRIFAITSLMAATLLAGCVSNPATSSPSSASSTTEAQTSTSMQALVKQRSEERWKFLVVRNFEKAYEFLTPSYRTLKTPDEYRGTFGNGANWKNPMVESVQCENDERCTVTIKLDVVVVASGFYKPIQSNLTEIWLKEEGQWWAYEKH